MELIFRRAALGRLGLVAVFVASLLSLSSEPAAACSIGPDWDRRAATEMFVLGRIVSVELRPSQLFPPSKSATTAYQKVVTMKVDLVLKGPAVETVTFVDAGYASKEVTASGAETIFWGGGGDCSAIEEDPRGRYGAFALGRQGELRSSILHGSAFGTGASDPAIARLIALHGLSLPSTSTESTSPIGAVAGLGLVAGAVFLSLATRWIRRRRDEPIGVIA